MEMSRFVIVGDKGVSREFLPSLFAFHPDIVTYGELFNRSDPQVMEELERQGVLMQIGGDPVQFLEEEVFDKSNARAVGFVLGYEHAQDPVWNHLWTYIRKNLQVIHVKRRNLLDRLVAARLVGEESVYLHPVEVEKQISESLRRRREQDIIWKFSRLLEVWSDDLSNVEVIRQVQVFLGVVPHDTLPVFSCSISQKDCIENYGELKSHFEGHEYGKYFTS